MICAEIDFANWSSDAYSAVPLPPYSSFRAARGRIIANKRIRTINLPRQSWKLILVPAGDNLERLKIVANSIELHLPKSETTPTRTGIIPA